LHPSGVLATVQRVGVNNPRGDRTPVELFRTGVVTVDNSIQRVILAAYQGFRM
jgi:hypothetical protein